MSALDSFRGHQLVPHAHSPYPGTRGGYRCALSGCDYHVVIDDQAPEGTVQGRDNHAVVGPRTAGDLGSLPGSERKNIRACPIGDGIAAEAANRIR